MTALTARQVSLNLGERQVLHAVDLLAQPGEILGLLGPNGAGKTTLIRLLAGLLAPQQGSVDLAGQPLQALGDRERAKRIAYLPQGHECHWPLKVREVVALGRLPHRAPWQGLPQADAAIIDTALEETDTLHLAERAINSLSGGERSRVLLARALATQASSLLADEPVAGLDPAHQLQVMSLLQGKARAGVTVVVVLHDLGLAARYCDRLCLLAEGRVIAQGMPGEVLSPEPLQQAYGIRAWYGEVEGERLVVPLGT
ncbi:MAG: ABC transporter ATP-binding protein [Nevskiales bacterium]